MPKRMLIDASHPEETRVVVLDGSKVEEFDFESASKRPLKGNIYLAKVTRVEPSLQAAFVEYGGGRQGFLAFAEIHPDYYQIPVADRQALLAEQEAEARRRQEDDIESFEITSGPKPASGEDEEDDEAEEAVAPDDGDEVREISGDALVSTLEAAPEAEDGADETVSESSGESHDEADHEDVFVNHGGAVVEDDHHDHDHEDEQDLAQDQTKSEAAHQAESDYAGDGDVIAAEAAMENEGEIEPVESDAAAGPDGEGGDAQALQAQRPTQKWVRKKHYKIQEVIKRRQIILVQVVKEERGNKGAALTTYLSLPGRYCVLMPNTPRGGGISRKITNAADRKRLKSAAQGLELPEGMGLIIRTAGENRTRLEIRRDYDYLLRLWDTIREKTLSSNAPANVYQEGDLIKRAIRDLYNKDVQDVIVEGEEGYRNAKDFMRMLMPAHARNVVQYRDSVPLYQRMHIEAQLDSMFSSTVTLKSGGYIVINQTEALVSIDVNSGRSTREHSIEETARKTNLEAASEVARQLRLRDLAGLIVIDFIDMEESRNDREVEKRLRDAVKNDRARVQIGKISQFGLMEMSRQRLRAGVVAGSTIPCPHCGGQGIVRSVESTALRVLRAIEEEGEKNRAAAVTCKIAGEVAIYILNQKRAELTRIENEHGMSITFMPNDDLPAGTFEMDRTKQRDPSERPRPQAVSIEAGFVPSDEPEPEYVEEIDEEEEIADDSETADDEDEALEERKPRPSRGDQPRSDQPRNEAGETDGDGRRRRRRGGRGRNRDRGPRPEGADQPRIAEAGVEQDHAAPQAVGVPPELGADGEPRRKRRRRRGRRSGRDRENPAAEGATGLAPEAARFGAPDEIDTTPGTGNGKPNAPSAPVWSLDPDGEIDTTPKDDDNKPVKKGWWQKAFGGE